MTCSRAVFAEGLNRIGVAVRVVPDSATLGCYFDSLAPQTADSEWPAFASWAVNTDRFPQFFPRLAELRDGLREFRGQRPLAVEAIEAYERVLKSGTYAPEGGATWSFRTIRDRLGEAVAEAFLSAGGDSAFRTTWNEDKRRERFLAAYVAAVREDPATSLLPAGQETKLLPAPAAPSIEEARAILRSIREHGDPGEQRPVEEIAR